MRPTQFDDRDATEQVTTNRRLIVEVLSPTGEANDRGNQFVRHTQAGSLQECGRVSQAEPRVDVSFRQAGRARLFTPVVGMDAVVRLRSTDVDLPLAEASLNVVSPAPADPPAAV